MDVATADCPFNDACLQLWFSSMNSFIDYTLSVQNIRNNCSFHDMK